MFKDFEILEDIMYYDGPLIFTCQNEHGHFLGYAVDWQRDPYIETFLFFKGTPEDFKPVMNSEITIRQFMKTYPIIYRAQQTKDGFGAEERIYTVPEAYIPKEGVYFAKDTDQKASDDEKA